MEIDLKNLPDDVAILKSLLIKQSHENAYLREIVRLFNYKQYVSKSERWEGQTLLFDEAEKSAPEVVVDESTDKSEVESHSRSRPKRKPFPEVIPRVEIIYDLSPDEKLCPCGCEMKVIGEETSEQLDIIPAKVQVLRHIRKKYCCQKCDGSFKTAGMPPQPIPKSMAAPGLLAFVATAKYADAMPLYRQESILSRIGIDLPRNTLASWMMKTAELLTPLMNLLRDRLLESNLIHMDETPLQVLKEKNKAATSKSYMWVQARGDPGEKIILFNYDPSRSAEVPRSLLLGFKGGLLTDGYEAYKSVAVEYGLIQYGCFDHARRKFHEALKGQKKGADSIAAQGMDFIGKLYDVEREHKASSPEIRKQAREDHSRKIVVSLRSWLDEAIDKVPPKSLTGKALYYLNSQWEKLIRYVDDGVTPMSNALAENAIRPFAVGRKNWLFSDTPRGAHASAALYSIIETAKANGIEPYYYLAHILTEIPKATKLEDFEALLPAAVRKKFQH
jgi:transposase